MATRSIMRILLQSFFIALLASSISAQVVRSYGLKVGAVQAEQHWEYTPQSGLSNSGISPIWGIDAGVFIELFNFPMFSFLTEINYIEKGRTLTVLESIPANNEQGFIDLGLRDFKNRFIYISIPFLVKLRAENETVIPYFAAGIRFDHLVSYVSTNVSDQFHKNEIGGIF